MRKKGFVFCFVLLFSRGKEEFTMIPQPCIHSYAVAYFCFCFSFVSVLSFSFRSFLSSSFLSENQSCYFICCQQRELVGCGIAVWSCWPGRAFGHYTRSVGRNIDESNRYPHTALSCIGF
ncbi:hypothetical protein B0T19DRAFT_51540 [Cercophora scortea]|uniref:Uncharacterized protein n=1 Tax=Cercophora scortea TaxID=314031 RepID=A0AAE0J4J8_9PEZI|nr:hypothetical protein B0T19DRAFT_51540 [Cercophora scortea]